MYNVMLYFASKFVLIRMQALNNTSCIISNQHHLPSTNETADYHSFF